MNQSSSRALIVALAVVTFMTLLPHEAIAGPRTGEAARTPAARAEVWREALQRFTAERPDLTPEQQQLLAQAVRLGDEIAALKPDARAQAAFARKATRLMERARELFSRNELGALFSSMGQTQVWLADVIAAEAFCDCIGSGSCTMGPGGPSGTCQGGCSSWDGDDGQRRNGLCGSANQQ